jgi:hypothetical protein
MKVLWPSWFSLACWLDCWQVARVEVGHASLLARNGKDVDSNCDAQQQQWLSEMVGLKAGHLFYQSTEPGYSVAGGE